ncbi:acyltransferase [Buttiauxella sp. S04-F03]|uniref:acyltransferase family protein n=1 Tax=Buttiauxella sp. S04-F03 TaxID=2904525 RepID=UPI001E2DB58C|nr:acyltransferase [Buttiauxella sp. S04-F03]MCE0812477.1 acyltransferase [Buttiauxella sp. S04-F03]
MKKSLVTKNKIDSIQFFRCIAIALVVYAHSFDRMERYSELSNYISFSDLAHFSRSGVDLFFIISGFIMSYITHNDVVSGKFSWRSFMYKRITRIVPMYWLVSLVVLVLLHSFPSIFYNTTTDIYHTLGSFFFVAIASPEGKFAPLLGVGWTLNLEMYFYLILALFIFFFKDKYIFRIFIFISLCASLGLLFKGRDELYIYSLITNPILLEFILGAFVYHLYKMNSRFLPDSLWYVLLAFSFIFISFTLFLQMPDDLRFLYWGVPYSILILCTLRIFEFYKFPKFFLIIGDASYSIYLTHYFIISGFYFILHRLGYDFMSNPFLVISTAMIFSILSGYAAYKLIEIKIVVFFKKNVSSKVGMHV